MKKVTVQFLINQPDADVYETISDLSQYQVHAEAVNKVEVTNTGLNSCHSTWEVKFRDGILKWSENDIFIPEHKQIDFYQTKGDLAIFNGSWKAIKLNKNSTYLLFTATLDLGLPQLESLLEPIAEQALVENITSIVNGLFKNNVNSEQDHSMHIDSTNEDLLCTK